MAIDWRSSAVREAQPALTFVEIPDALARRVIVANVRPRVDDGRFPIKRTVGETVDVVADIFADGHDVLTAVLRFRQVQRPEVQGSVQRSWFEVPMTPVGPGTDEWMATFPVDEVGWHEYSVVAWVDPFRTWQRDLEKSGRAGQDLNRELFEGAVLVRDVASRAKEISTGVDDGAWLLIQADALSETSPVSERVGTATAEALGRLMFTYADRSRATESARYQVWVDRERARFGSWYEMFPRSAGPDAARSGTFEEARALLPRIADLGFDVLYLPPIHPIGTSFRKGRNNSLAARPGDPGSPWAIGSPAGGHTAVDPGLGTLDDFRTFRAAAEALGLELALDLAWQCSPDHPWVREHPDWFRHRPDGTIKCAENPPKTYQDIYPIDFESDDWRSLWVELLAVTRFWIDRGVRIFRVDNPHTKSFGFWEWLIDQVRGRNPDVLFLSEAFTRPKPMHYLVKAGFTQSYTYFTWRNTKEAIATYLTELTATTAQEYFRPNLFVNTPDILHAYLQTGGRAAFQVRLLLAATLGSSYGLYSGFELAEKRAVPGTEEYADSEKYQFRKWDWGRPGHIEELVAQVNRIRRKHRALQFDRTLRFHDTDNPQLIAYSKTDPRGSDTLLMVVNLDPHHMQHGHVDASFVGAEAFQACDLLDETAYTWRKGWNYVRLDPEVRQGHILQITHGS